MKNTMETTDLKHNRSKYNTRLFLFIIFVLFSSSFIFSQERPIVHDPVMIKQDSIFYLFCTGPGITVFTSTDLQNWEQQDPVFKEAPDWALERVPGFNGHIWAPDISYHNDIYYLYYSVSSFGKNTSCIGLATNVTLNPNDPEFEWKDQGIIVQSVPCRDLWNAIDPNIVIDNDGIPWMTFGSFWEGIKIVQLNKDLTGIKKDPEVWKTIARRERDFLLGDEDPGNAAIEAPFIFRKGKYYYLFVSWDLCCRGKESTYKIVVGRSESVTGPYIDKTGKSMFNGGGSVVLEGNENWYGVGHNSAYTFDGKDYLIFHGYDVQQNGLPKLIIKELSWDKDRWPFVTEGL